MNFPTYVVVLTVVFVVTMVVVLRLPFFQKRTGLILAIYLLAVLTITIIARLVLSERLDCYIQLDPFRKYRSIYYTFRNTGSIIGFSDLRRTFTACKSVVNEIILNILLFVPFGLLVPLRFRFLRKFWILVLLGFGFSLFIEVTQCVTLLGCMEGSDLVHNTIGAGLGYLLCPKLIYREHFKGSENVAQIE